MTAKIALHYADIAIVLSSLTVLALIIRKKQAKTYAFLIALLSLRALVGMVSFGILFHRAELGLSVQRAYNVYFYTYWPSSVIQLVLQILTIFSVYRIAMKPLDGLKRIGTIIFRWVMTVSAVLSTIVALGPHNQGETYFATLFAQAQEGVSILIVCLLVFVCFAARPLGLTYRSRAFGVTLGLGINSTAGLVLSAWFSTTSTHSLYAPVFAIGAVVSAASIGIWGVYFALPEPQRKLVVLPTTSPYFLWNRISEALGDDPGVVAVAGFTPAMLAPAELLALSASAQPRRAEAVADSMPVHALAASM